MSAIDCYDHVHVADFYGIPVYWPQEEFLSSRINNDHDDIIIGKSKLLIGGGSGEHPALIIDIEHCIFQLIMVLELDSDNENYEEFIETIGYESVKPNTNNWDMDSYINLNNEMGDHHDLKFWDKFYIKLGLFILKYMPLEYCISNDLTLKCARYAYHDGILSTKDVRELYTGIELPSQKYGRKRTDTGLINYDLKDWYNDHTK